MPTNRPSSAVLPIALASVTVCGTTSSTASQSGPATTAADVLVRVAAVSNVSVPRLQQAGESVPARQLPSPAPVRP